jgi:RNA recognition motif-containing protein
VGNLSFSTSREKVEELFSQVGDIVEVFLPSDRMTGRPRGFAFVEFSDPAAANDAIEKFDGFELDGRALRVNAAEDRPRRSMGPMMDPDSSFSSGGRPGGGRPSKPKGSRRNLRGKKRSL